jgi:titin
MAGGRHFQISYVGGTGNDVTLTQVIAPLYTVTNTNDEGIGSLRWVLTNANANPGPDTIDFAIGTGVQTITPLSALPIITGPVTIDGTTQPGFAGTPIIELNGSSAGSGVNGLTINGGSSTVRGLVINRFAGDGIRLQSSNNVVAGNYIGTNVAGTAALGNVHGVQATGASAVNNTIGGTTAADRNLLSGNTHGVRIGDSVTGTQVLGNYIGTNATGTLALGNTGFGIIIQGAGSNNTIGGATAGARNIIAGNGTGIWLNNVGVGGTFVQGNFIGTDVAGNVDLGNNIRAILIQDAPNNTIGGGTAGAGNLISGTNGDGVLIFGPGSTGNVLQGNFIGTNAAGTASVPNGNGISISGAAKSNLIGSNGDGVNDSAERNIISGNTSRGVHILGAGTDQNIVAGNYLGTDVTGTVDLGNKFAGVEIENASGNIVGGTAAGAGNLISGNDGPGLRIVNSTNTVVQGNYIGTNAAGTAALGNTVRGIFITGGAANNLIGGTTAGARNIISGTLLFEGIGIFGSATGNRVQGNYIGTDVTGTVDLGNKLVGVGIFNASSGNIIGGSAAGAGNLIAGNDGHGLWISNSNGTVVQGNRIGTTVTGIALLGNGSSGIFIDGGSSNSLVGGTTAGAGNIIAGNVQSGVRILGSTTTGNSIRGNSIHSNGGLGIDLGGDGVTANDAGDADSGPNNLQNFPVLSAAVPGASTAIAGTLNSQPNTTFKVDFYASATADPSGYGEGQRYLGSITVTTDGSGNASFNLLLAAATSAGEILTATATDPSGNTSEFSLAVAVQATTQVLTTVVTSLVSSGTLNQGQGNSLLAPLNAAQQQINSGNYTAAINQLQAFINHVSALVNAGILDQQNGDLLIGAALLLIQQLGG